MDPGAKLSSSSSSSSSSSKYFYGALFPNADGAEQYMSKIKEKDTKLIRKCNYLAFNKCLTHGFKVLLR